MDTQGQLAGVKLGAPSFLGGTASQLYVQSGTVQLSDPVIVVEETFTSRDGGATWQKVTFAGGAVHLLDASADGRAPIGLASDDLTRVEVSLDAGQTWRKLPVKPSDVPGFGAFYVAPDGSVIATSQRLGMVDRPDNRIFLVRPGASSGVSRRPCRPTASCRRSSVTRQATTSRCGLAMMSGPSGFVLSHPLS